MRLVGAIVFNKLLSQLLQWQRRLELKWVGNDGGFTVHTPLWCKMPSHCFDLPGLNCRGTDWKGEVATLWIWALVNHFDWIKVTEALNNVRGQSGWIKCLCQRPRRVTWAHGPLIGLSRRGLPFHWLWLMLVFVCASGLLSSPVYVCLSCRLLHVGFLVPFWGRRRKQQ